jgi:hypothetical protein
VVAVPAANHHLTIAANYLTIIGRFRSPLSLGRSVDFDRTSVGDLPFEGLVARLTIPRNHLMNGLRFGDGGCELLRIHVAAKVDGKETLPDATLSVKNQV